MSLSGFFAAWYRPIVLEAEGADAATITSLAESIAWWTRTTGDPPLCTIDEFTIATFKTELSRATYSRGMNSPQRPLSRATIAKHLKQVRAVLYRTGPTTDPDRPAKNLLAVAPHIKVQGARMATPKPPFTIAAARAVYAATAELTATSKLDAATLQRFARALLSLLYYTGLRIGTLRALRWSHLCERPDGVWILAPGDIVKTGQRLEKWLHPAALVDLEPLERSPAGLVLNWPHCKDHLDTIHERLQAAAGLSSKQGPPNLPKPLSIHAWRRTNIWPRSPAIWKSPTRW